jgi:hypothetical protein
MNAKVKSDYRWNNIRACAGTEFIKGEFRTVPAGLEAEALSCDMLEFEPEATPEPEPEAPIVSEVQKTSATRRDRKPKPEPEAEATPSEKGE